MVIQAARPIVIGQRVSTILYGRGPGVVFRITGDQRPGSIGSMGGGAVAYGGAAHFDIVFHDGSRSNGLPECILWGVQWSVYDEVADGDEIARLLHAAEHEEARKATEKEANEIRRAAERVKHLADNPHLTPKTAKPNYSPGRLAAENIRKELKRAMPRVKFSITSDYNSVRVGWTNGPTSTDVQAITGKYKAGGFDGMNDIYEHDPDATFGDVFGDPRYVFCQRADTLEGVRKAWQLAGYNPAEVPAGWENGSRWECEHSDAMARMWSETSL